MTTISYRFLNGVEVGQWPGTGYRDEKGRSRKKGQIFLGKVIDKEKNIFWKRKQGFYIFVPKTLEFVSPNPADIPSHLTELDGARKAAPVIVDFGDCFFFNELIERIGYIEVLKSIECSNLDSLKALIAYYTLDCGVASEALGWYKQSYASYLYPKANLHDQRISELLQKISSPVSVRKFITAHIKYILDNTDGELSVLIDSTGLPNQCALPITRISVHEGEVNLEFRMIAVVQKSTGLPLYYEYIAGNIVDISTLERTILILSEHKCNVDYCIGDAGYCNQGIMVKMIMLGIEFMTRLNPAYNLFKDAFNEHKNELLFDYSNTVRYGSRIINVIKVPMTVGYDKKTGQECKGFVYLCMDLQARASKIDHLLGSKIAYSKTTQELLNIQEKYGVFGILSTRDIPKEQVLPDYYVRQGVEQYFDFAKNYAKFLPVQQHNMETMQGHLLISFISSFLFVLIKNRLRTASRSCVEVTAQNRTEDEMEISYLDDSGKQCNTSILEQKPVKNIASISAKWIFHDLRGQKADVFSGRIIPSVPTAQANMIYEAFGLQSPIQVKRKGLELMPDYKDDFKDRTKALAFSKTPPLTDDEILNKRKSKEKSSDKDKSDKELSSAVKINKRGRPAGAKNKKTIELERKIASGEIQPPPKPKIGRPKGAKNKKTLEREAKIASGEIKLPPKPKRGRPIGAKDSAQRIRRTQQQIRDALSQNKV